MGKSLSVGTSTHERRVGSLTWDIWGGWLFGQM
jgi:hypothetical protein